MAENQHYYWLPQAENWADFFKVLCSLKIPESGRDDMPSFGGRVNYPGFRVIYWQELPPPPNTQAARDWLKHFSEAQEGESQDS